MIRRVRRAQSLYDHRTIFREWAAALKQAWTT